MPQKDDFIERQIVIGLIASTSYLERIVAVYKTDYFESDEAGLISKWCVQYFNAYKKAPGLDIQLVYDSKSKRLTDKHQRQLIEGILDTLSNEWEQIEDTFNELYLYDKTIEYFQIRSFSILSTELRNAVTGYDADAGNKILDDHNKIQALNSPSIDPFGDVELIDRAFEQSANPLFKIPGALGAFVNDQLVPEGFIGLLGPEKRGKTWWLMQLAMWSVRGGCPTGIIQAGDMSDEEMTLRMHIHLARRSNRKKYCGDIYVPVLDCRHNQSDTCTKRCRTGHYGLAAVDGQEKTHKRNKKTSENDAENKKVETSPELILKENLDYIPCSECYRDNPLSFPGAVYWTVRPACDPLTAAEAKKQGQRFKNICKVGLELSTHPARTLTVDGIRAVLDRWDRVNKFVPKTLVIDYAQILRATHNNRSIREQQMEIATDLRGLAQERKILLITGWQADAASYEKDTLGISNFSETKDIYGRVTAMWGLNQTAQEVKKGIMRINQLVVRNDYFESGQTISVLQNLQTGRPYISSFLTR